MIAETKENGEKKLRNYDKSLQCVFESYKPPRSGLVQQNIPARVRFERQNDHTCIELALEDSRVILLMLFCLRVTHFKQEND